MPNITLTITPNLNRLGDAFRKMPLSEAIQTDLERLALSTERGAKSESPVDTGRLRASITTDIGNLQARVAPHVVYAIFVHEGTRFMRGRPFMSRGLERAITERGGIKGVFETRISKVIDEELRKVR